MKATSIGFLAAGLAASAVAFALPQKALAAFPDKPVSFIVPFGAGGGFDRLARALAKSMEKKLGVAVPIKNTPGAGGRRGSIRLFKSKADGYTIGFAHFVPFQTDQLLRGKKTSIDYRKFAVVYKVSQARHFLFVNKKLAVKSVADLKKLGRTVKFSSTGVGAITWVEANALGGAVGFSTSFVTGYKNLPAAALAVAKGETDAGFGSAHHFKGVEGDVRVITVLGATRDSHYADVPSIKEVGYPGLTNLGSPRVVSAPPGTPEARLSVIRKAVRDAVADPEFKKWAAEAGYVLTPEEPKQIWKSLATNADIYRGLKPLVDKASGKK